jgi:hypothetical protein
MVSMGHSHSKYTTATQCGKNTTPLIASGWHVRLRVRARDRVRGRVWVRVRLRVRVRVRVRVTAGRHVRERLSCGVVVLHLELDGGLEVEGLYEGRLLEHC